MEKRADTADISVLFVFSCAKHRAISTVRIGPKDDSCLPWCCGKRISGSDFDWLYCVTRYLANVKLSTPLQRWHCVFQSYYTSETEARMDYNMVVCTVCNMKMRKNKWLIDRHWENNHKDREEKGEKATTMIPSAGSRSMKDFLGLPGKDDKNKKKDEEKDGAEELGGNAGRHFELEETADEEEILVRSVEKSSEVQTDTRKRVLVDSENNNPDSSKKLKEESGMEEILRKLGTIERKVDDMQNGRKAQSEKVEESVHSGSFDGVDKMFKESSTVGQLEEILQSINFKKVEDVNDGVDGFYCELCFGGSEPNWESLPKSAAGAFKYTKAEEMKLRV